MLQYKQSNIYTIIAFTVLFLFASQQVQAADEVAPSGCKIINSPQTTSCVSRLVEEPPGSGIKKNKCYAAGTNSCGAERTCGWSVTYVGPDRTKTCSCECMFNPPPTPSPSPSPAGQ
jgi:hypothetical protein